MIHIISMWHNEEYLAPLFLEHYKRADKITIILDDCSDCTREYLGGCEVEEIKTGGLDDIAKAKLLSAAAFISDADIRIIVDADEFIYPTLPMDVRPRQIYSVGFFEVFRHQSDKDIDRTQPPLQQRKHGNPKRGQSFGQDHFVKPIVFGPGSLCMLEPGNHYNMSDDPVIDNMFDGAHWAMADTAISLSRRFMKRHRMSQVNYDNGLTSHDWNVTAQDILKDSEKMIMSPEVISTDRERF
jgi:hypothetical protein